jgi:hypothetical protein
MLITCTTKGCAQMTEAKLNKATDEVICESCGNVIENVTSYMKKTLASIGQVMSGVKKQAFQALCPNCKRQQPLFMKDNHTYCQACNTQVVVSAAFMNGLKIFQDIKKDEPAE